MVGEHDDKRRISDLGIEYLLFGNHLIQAVGEIGGRDFYFHAKDSDWFFEVADSKNVLPSDGGHPHFVRRGKRLDAGYMPHDEVAAMIEAFLREYICTVPSALPTPVQRRPSLRPHT
jgi:hypothetical protein